MRCFRLTPILLLVLLYVGCDSITSSGGDEFSYQLIELGDDGEEDTVASLALANDQALRIDSSAHISFNIAGETIKIVTTISNLEKEYTTQDYNERAALFFYLIAQEGEEVQIAVVPQRLQYQDDEIFGFDIDCGEDNLCKGVIRTFLIKNNEVRNWIVPEGKITVQLEQQRRVAKEFSFYAPEKTFDVEVAQAPREELQWGTANTANRWNTVYSKINSSSNDIITVPLIIRREESEWAVYNRYEFIPYGATFLSEYGKYMGTKDEPRVLGNRNNETYTVMLLGIQIPR